VPSVNENPLPRPVKHFWTPEWCKGDCFLERTDYAGRSFGCSAGCARWLSLGTTWVAETIAWVFLAWSGSVVKRRLVPRPLAADVSAALFFREHFLEKWPANGCRRVKLKCFAFTHSY